MDLIYFILFQNIYWGAISWKFYTAAERKAWEAFVPFYNLWVLVKISEKPWWWFILFLIPVVGTVMTVIIIYELLHVYGFRKASSTFLVIITLGLYLGYLNYTEQLKHIGRDNAYIKANLGEFVNALFFAVVAATIIRSTTFEAYTIPTSSMEKSMMIGDFLFVSKLHYGVRLPMTPISVPLIHNKIPGTSVKSFIEWPSIPYFRFPAFESIDKNDIVVFNYPEETFYPVDKRENYVKRCVGVAGDSLKIIDRQIFVNGEAQTLPDRSLGMFSYYVRTKGGFLSKKQLKEKFDITMHSPKENKPPEDVLFLRAPSQEDPRPIYEYIVWIPVEKIEAFKQLPYVVEVIPVNADPDMDQSKDSTLPKSLRSYYRMRVGTWKQNRLFPNPQGVHSEAVFPYTLDNYGPIYIPKEGATVELTPENVLSYRRIIEIYENNTFEEQEGQYLINGEPATTYTFGQNYYWMMGDNRHNSLDSRFWGYVPEDHIVGKPVFIWMSIDYNEKKIRTDRVFTTVHGEGERKSYFFHVLIVAILGWGVNRYLKKRKKARNAA